MKKIIAVILIVAGIGFGGFFYLRSSQEIKVEVKTIDKQVQAMMTVDPAEFVLRLGRANEQVQNRKKLVKTFIQQKLMKDGAIITNYLPNETEENLATGHDLLSESAGIYLLDLASTDTKGRFDAFYAKTKETFYTGTQFSYRVTDEGTKYQVNASLDDLRILRALIVAKQAFQTQDYDQEIDLLSKQFLAQSTKSNLLIDFYDEENDQQSQDISLFYLDYKTLGYIYALNGVDAKYLQYQVNIAKNGYISDEFPLYHQRYNYKTQEYQDGDSVNIIESLLTIRYLAEVGEADPASIAFVKEHVAKGTLFNSYDLNGNAIDKNQSAASYAIAALIGYFIDDDDLYEQSIAILENFQNTDPNSVLYGGFGDSSTKEVYSYNNLMALLAFSI